MSSTILVQNPFTVPFNNMQTLNFKTQLTDVQFMAMWKKVDLSKGYWYPKRKLEVTTHFSKIVEVQ